MSERESFLESPSLERLETFKKVDLIWVAEKLPVGVNASMRKGEIKRLIVEKLVDEDVLPEKLLDEYQPIVYTSDLRRVEMELQAQKEMRKMELDAQVKAKKLEYKIMQLECKKEKNVFDLGKQVRLVPPFNEDDVDNFFLHFEKVATSLDWPERHWALLVQSVLRGKAQEAYSALSVEECSDYASVKVAILKAYELVPEAYRQKFRNYLKSESQTHVEFSHEKEVYFDRWCASKGVNNNFENLKQVVLVEEFKKCVRDDIKVYLDEQNVDTLQRAATIADDYALTHKSFNYRNKNFAQFRKFPQNKDKPIVGVGGPKSSEANVAGSASQSEVGGKRPVRSFSRVCHYCKKSGHMMSDCWSLKKKRESRLFPNALVSSKSCDNSVTEHIDSKSGRHDLIRDEFKPFVSEGFVSLSGEEANSIPIKILRDTGATQSLFLEGVLPLNLSTSTGEQVIAQGIEGGFVNIPLHRINLTSGLVSGQVVVGIRPTLPVKGVALLLGNDLAGGRVIADPKVTSQPVTVMSTEKLNEDIPGIFPSCVVTRAMAKKAQEELEVKQSNEDVLDLSKTVLSEWFNDERFNVVQC